MKAAKIASQCALPDNAPHILVVDDDQRIRDLLAPLPVEHGFRVTTATDAASARAAMRGPRVRRRHPRRDDARRKRPRSRARPQGDSTIPICMLTARAEPEQRIEGLETGVDDYIAKPFEPRELLLRLQNILKRGRARPGRSDEITHGRLHASTSARGELKRKDETIKLTERERDLLRLFAQRPARRSPATSWPATIPPAASAPSTCRSTGCAARSRPTPPIPVYLQTVRGKGYILHTD